MSALRAAAGDLTGAGQPGFLSPTGVEIAFVLVGVVALGSALLVVTTRQVVHAALWLVVTLGALAVEFLLMTAEFVAWVQVLIYVGAVVVLLLFGLMLTRAPIGPGEGDGPLLARVPALIVAGGAAATLLWVVIDAFGRAYVDLGETGDGSAEATGQALFRTWVLPFEVLSVLLLAALVGAIVLSRAPDGRPGASRALPGAARGRRPGAPSAGAPVAPAGPADAAPGGRAAGEEG